MKMHPIQEEVKIQLVASVDSETKISYPPFGPLDSNADVTVFIRL